MKKIIMCCLLVGMTGCLPTVTVTSTAQFTDEQMEINPSIHVDLDSVTIDYRKLKDKIDDCKNKIDDYIDDHKNRINDDEEGGEIYYEDEPTTIDKIVDEEV